MRPKRESLLLPRLLERIAPKIGARVYIEPEWGIVGQITFKSGRKCYFRYNTLDLNPVGSSDIAKDKDYATLFMARMGYPTIPGKAFYSAEWSRAIRSRRDIDAAYSYAKRIGFPVIAKPNSGSQGGGVGLVYTKRELYRSLRDIFKRDRVALVQRFIEGNDYRLVVLDDEVISAYERIPLNIAGDGHSTVLQLLKNKQRQFGTSGRDTKIMFADARIAGKLKRQGLSMRSVLRAGHRIALLDNANLSTGGDAVDVTNVLHPGWKKLATKLTRDMGLRMCGVDLLIQGDIREAPRAYHVIEINAAPGLDHYVKTGHTQQKAVEALYLKVLKHLER